MAIQLIDVPITYLPSENDRLFAEHNAAARARLEARHEKFVKDIHEATDQLNTLLNEGYIILATTSYTVGGGQHERHTLYKSGGFGLENGDCRRAGAGMLAAVCVV